MAHKPRYDISTTRDYLVDCFRLHAGLGGHEQFRRKLEQIKSAAVQEQNYVQGNSGLPMPTEAAMFRMDEATENLQLVLRDLEAVGKTLRILERRNNGAEIMQAIKYIYMAEPDKPLTRGVFKERVRWCEIHIPAAERTIYYWLKTARLQLMAELGMRTKNNIYFLKSLQECNPKT